MLTLLAVVLVVAQPRANAETASVKPDPAHLIVGPSIAIPQELYATAPESSLGLIGPAQARTAATTMWNEWEKALVASDTRALTQLAVPGHMLTGIINACASPSGRCVYETRPRAAEDVVVIVPAQKSYPAYFLAEVRTKSYVNESNGLVDVQPWMAMEILTKSSPTAAWKLAFLTGYDSASPSVAPGLLPFAEISDASTGEVFNPVPITSRPVPASTFLPKLAAYWQSYKVTGHAPPASGFVSNGYTSGVGSQLAQSRQGSVYNGLRQSYAFAADPSQGTWLFSIDGNFPMMCGSIVDRSTDTAVKGLLNQNSNESNYGVPLAPGEYRSIHDTTDHETCIFPVQGGLDAAGNNVYTAAVTGKRIKPPKGPKSTILTDVETDYGVLAYQYSQYVKQLRSCSGTQASCEKAFAVKAEQQFGRFATQLKAETYPPRAQAAAEKLQATAARVVFLFGNLAKGSEAASTSNLLATEVALLASQFKALVTDLK